MLSSCYALKRVFDRFAKFIHRSRKTALLILTVASLTTIFNVLITVWLTNPYNPMVPNSSYNPNSMVPDSSYNPNPMVPDSSHNQTVPNTGTMYITSVEAYGGDVKSTGNLVYIDWGALYPGISKSVSFYLKSKSNINVTLELNVTDWAPEVIASYMDVSWNYTGTKLSPEEEIPVSVNLDISSSQDFINYLITNEVEAFSFDIHIYASKV